MLAFLQKVTAPAKNAHSGQRSTRPSPTDTLLMHWQLSRNARGHPTCHQSLRQLAQQDPLCPWAQKHPVLRVGAAEGATVPIVHPAPNVRTRRASRGRVRPFTGLINKSVDQQAQTPLPFQGKTRVVAFPGG